MCACGLWALFLGFLHRQNPPLGGLRAAPKSVNFAAQSTNLTKSCLSGIVICLISCFGFPVDSNK